MLCKNCGAPVSVNEFTGIAECEYCGAVFDLTGAKVDFTKIHDYLEKIRYFKNKGVLVKPAIKVVNGKIIYPDQLSSPESESYNCISCHKHYSRETIIRHMFSSHPELIDSSKTIPFIRKHPELVNFLKSFIDELHQKEQDLKDLRTEYAQIEREHDQQEQKILQSTGRYLLSYAFTTFIRIFLKTLIFIIVLVSVIAGLFYVLFTILN